jgi:hypothetical protein
MHTILDFMTSLRLAICLMEMRFPRIRVFASGGAASQLAGTALRRDETICRQRIYSFWLVFAIAAGTASLSATARGNGDSILEWTGLGQLALYLYYTSCRHFHALWILI